jgi:hypothetical protein
MKIDRLTGIALIVLGIGAAVSAILGPLVLGVIQFRVSESAENQLIGGEIVSLCAVAPLAIGAGVLWLRGHRLAPVLALGPAGYAVYTYVQFVIGPEYARYAGNNERFFPLFLALIILGWFIAARAWSALGAASLPPIPDGTRRLLAGLLIVVAVAFALLWSKSIADVLGGTESQAYRDDTTLFWLVRLMDLAFIIPASLLTGIGLPRRVPWAARLAYGLVLFLTLEVGAVAAMAVSLAVRDDPSASPAFVVIMLAFTAGLALVVVRLVRALLAGRADGSGQPSTAQSGRPAVWR